MTRPFNAWREGAILYVPWLVMGIAFIAAAWPRPVMALGVVFLAVGLFTLFFFRDPPRTIAADPAEIVAPADGKVVAIDDLEHSPHYDGPTRRVSIFLSILDVHINRAPTAGVVQTVTYQPGRFKVAMAPDTTDCNEATTIHMDTGNGPVTVRQIAGLVARRIVCKTTPGDELAQGEKFGMIKFGSRTELYLPPTTTICVTLNDKVHAGKSIMARFE